MYQWDVKPYTLYPSISDGNSSKLLKGKWVMFYRSYNICNLRNESPLAEDWCHYIIYNNFKV